MDKHITFYTATAAFKKLDEWDHGMVLEQSERLQKRLKLNSLAALTVLAAIGAYLVAGNEADN